MGLQAGAVSSSPFFPLIFTLAVLLVFAPLRDRVQAFVDRVFFRTRYDGAHALAAVGAQLAGARQRHEIIRLVQESVVAAIPVDGVAVESPADTIAAPLAAELEAGRVVTAFDPPEAFVAPERCEAVRQALAARQWEIAVPMLQQDRLVGMLGLGAKRSGLFFTAGDAEYLRALAQAAAIALDNATAYEALQTLNAELETRVTDRTAKLSQAYDELKTAQVQLVQSEKMASLGRLAAGVAHEINNPVSFIVSNVPPLQQWLERLDGIVPDSGRPLLQDAREIVDIMGRGAARTAAIVRDLRSFSRVGEAPRKPVDLHEALDVAIRLLESRWRDRLTIERNYGTLPLVECDAGQMNQVFMNVLSNACDATPPRGTIRVSTTATVADATVTISDDGAGIPPENLPRLFDPFFTTKDVGAGTGLGLAIVHGIVAAHAGHIEVESTVGTGTTVRITVPLRPPIA